MYFRFRDSLIKPRLIASHNGKLFKTILYLLFLVILMCLPSIIYNAVTGVVSGNDIIDISDTLSYENIPYRFENNTLLLNNVEETPEVYVTSKYSFIFTNKLRSEFIADNYVNSYLNSVNNISEKLNTINFVFCGDGIYIMLYASRLQFVDLGDYIKYEPVDFNLNDLRDLSVQANFRDFLRDIRDTYKSTLIIGSIVYLFFFYLFDLLTKMAIPILFSVLLYKRLGVTFKFIFETTVSCCTAYALINLLTFGNPSFVLTLIGEFILIVYLMINLAGNIRPKEE